MLKNKPWQKQTETVAAAQKQPKVRFVLGSSECYFEPAESLAPLVNEAAVERLLRNPNAQVLGTEGRSLKVLFHAPTEIKFCGFITAGDASVELEEADFEELKDAAFPVTRAISAEDLVALF